MTNKFPVMIRTDVDSVGAGKTTMGLVREIRYAFEKHGRNAPGT